MLAIFSLTILALCWLHKSDFKYLYLQETKTIANQSKKISLQGKIGRNNSSREALLLKIKQSPIRINLFRSLKITLKVRYHKCLKQWWKVSKYLHFFLPFFKNFTNSKSSLKFYISFISNIDDIIIISKLEFSNLNGNLSLLIIIPILLRL